MGSRGRGSRARDWSGLTSARGERFDALEDGTCAHRAFVDIERAGRLFAEDLFADAEARAHREEDRLGQTTLHQLDAPPDRIAAPKPHHLEIHARRASL